MWARSALAVVCALGAILTGAPAASAAPCATSLFDVSGLTWDIVNSGEVGDGHADAYDPYGALLLNPNGGNAALPYANPDTNGCTTEDGGREIVFPTDTDAGDLGVNAYRKVYVPSGGKPFGRWLDIIENPTGSPVTITVEWYGEYGEVSTATGTESGDAVVDVGERWASFDQDGDGGDTEFSSIWDGPGGDGWDRPFNGDEMFVPGDDNDDVVDYMYDDVTIAPGGRAIFMHIEHQNATVAGALSFVLANGDGTPEFFAGMTEDELLDLRNWDFDFDDDGLFNEDDNCPSAANADQADLDGDGLGDACDDDDDGDGLSDATEAAMGTNAGSSDSDGDGNPDGVDQCPTRAGAESGCPPLAGAAGAGPPAGPGASPTTLPRLTPNRLTLRVRRTRTRRRLTLRLSGALLLPAGVRPADGCRAGAVQLIISARGRVVRALLVDLRPDCTFSRRIVLRRAGLRRRRLSVQGEFTGNERLSRRRSGRVAAGRG